MAVPLPTDAEVKLQPPDVDEVHVIGQGLMGAAAPTTGLTDLQKVLIKAIVHSMTGVSVGCQGSRRGCRRFAGAVGAGGNLAFPVRRRPQLGRRRGSGL
jgi:hypothetical protein